MDEQQQEVIVLHDIEGIVRKSGTDQHGCVWLQWEIDWLAEEEPGECSICGAEMESGWVCLDGGDEVCDWHIRYAEEEESA